MQFIKVSFVDDHPILLSGLCQLFSASGEFQVVGVGRSAQDIISLTDAVAPDVMVVDLNMPGRVLEAILKVSTAGGGTKLLAFTAATGIDTAIAALEAGALGYLQKGCSLDELTEAIRQVHRGETYVAPTLAARVVAGLQELARARKMPKVTFSKREEDVLRLLLKGSTNKCIAEALSISEKTVKHYMTVLIQTLDVRNRVEVVLAAQDLAGKGMLQRPNSLN